MRRSSVGLRVWRWSSSLRLTTEPSKPNMASLNVRALRRKVRKELICLPRPNIVEQTNVDGLINVQVEAPMNSVSYSDTRSIGLRQFTHHAEVTATKYKRNRTRYVHDELHFPSKIYQQRYELSSPYTISSIANSQSTFIAYSYRPSPRPAIFRSQRGRTTRPVHKAGE